MFQVPSGTKEFFCRPSRDFFIWWTLYPAMNGWAIVTASLRDFAAFAPFARQKFKRPLPRSSTPNCHWPPGWDIAGERARPGGRFRRRAKNRFPIPKGLNHSAQGCAVHAGQANSATLGNHPTNFPTRNGLHHLPPKLMKPRWGKIHFTIITRRSRCASTPG